jgi:hypothetical protein
MSIILALDLDVNASKKRLLCGGGNNFLSILFSRQKSRNERWAVVGGLSTSSTASPPPPGAHLRDFWRENNPNFYYSGELRTQLRTHKKAR